MYLGVSKNGYRRLRDSSMFLNRGVQGWYDTNHGWGFFATVRGTSRFLQLKESVK